jgi:hypothetical protein
MIPRSSTQKAIRMAALLMTVFLVLGCALTAPVTPQGEDPVIPAEVETPAQTSQADHPVVGDPVVGDPVVGDPAPASPPPADTAAYDIGAPELMDFYVSPSGSDAADGTDEAHPLRTLSEAWSRIPASPTGTGFRVNLLPGVYPCEPGPEDTNCVNFFADRAGSAEFPIILRAAGGPGTVTLRGGMNIANVRYVYLIDLNLVGGGSLPTNSSGNNLLHLDGSDHILLRGLSVLGPDCANDTCNNLQEVLKVNQTQYLYVEYSEIGGAWHSAVDYFVVQYGHFRGNTIHTAGQWCMYIKGGTAYLTIDGNILHDCQLGFQSGQSANLAVMRSPWFHYETYGVRFTNNILHDIPGIALSAAGAYNMLFAYNTLYKVGYSQDPAFGLFQLVFGERNCTPIDEIPNVTARCPKYTDQGAWGPASVTESLPAVPNQSVYFYNNLVYNPAPSQTAYTHFNVAGPISLPQGFRNLPEQIVSDHDIRMAGNWIWNGPPDLPLGIEDPGNGCQPDNPTCNLTLLTAQNSINQVEPKLADPARGDYHLALADNAPAALSIPAFTWQLFTPPVPAGAGANDVILDLDGLARTGAGTAGAFNQK